MSAELVPFDVDLTSHEHTRLAAVIDALGDRFDPVAALDGERAAHALLYSGLDAQQQAVYRQLAYAGILGARSSG